MKDIQVKNPPLKYLIYNELAILRKSIRINAILALLVLVGVAIIQLGMTYGNLGKYEEFEELVQFMQMPLVCMISMLPFVFTEALLGSTKLDTESNWIKFRLSTPVSAFRLVLAKYLTLLGSLAVSIIISAIGICLLALFGNNAITPQNIKLGIMFGLVMFILVIVMQVSMLYFRSQDKAGLVMLGVMAALIVPIYLKLSTPENSLKTGTDIFNLVPKLVEYFPIVAIAAVAVLVIGFILTVIIFKRRER